jgi:hypothetical protein
MLDRLDIKLGNTSLHDDQVDRIPQYVSEKNMRRLKDITLGGQPSSIFPMAVPR